MSSAGIRTSSGSSRAPPSGARPDYVLQQRWVLWSGEPELVLVARDRTGRTVWSGAIYGNEDQFPSKISDKIAAICCVRADERHAALTPLAR